MSATASCVVPIKGTVYRMIALDTCGNPITGTGGNVITSKGFVQVAMTPQYQAGVEFFEVTADGTPCVNQIDDAVLKRYELVMDFCETNQTGASWMASMRELTSSNGATGYGFAGQEGQMTNRWSLEVWQRIAGQYSCDINGAQQYIYNAWPNVGAAQLGAYTILNDKSTLTITAETRAVSLAPTVGWGKPSNQSSTSYLPPGFAAQAADHWYWSITSVAPPAPACNPLYL